MVKDRVHVHMHTHLLTRAHARTHARTHRVNDYSINITINLLTTAHSFLSITVNPSSGNIVLGSADGRVGSLVSNFE